MKKLLRTSIIVALILLMVVVPVAATENQTDTTPTPEDDGFMVELEALWQTLVSFVLASIIWALSGFFKVEDPNTEAFDPVQFFTTMIVGLVAGLIAFVIYITTGTSLMPSQIWEYLVAAGFVALIETWLKVLWRRLKPYFTPPTVAS